MSEQNPSCAARGSELILQKLKEQGVNVQGSCCFGHCAKGVVVRVPDGKFYYGVTENDISTIIEQTKTE